MRTIHAQENSDGSNSAVTNRCETDGVNNDALIYAKARMFWNAVQQGDKKTVASCITYPIRLLMDGKEGMEEIDDAATFIEKYDVLFTPPYVKVISEASPRNMTVKPNGVVLGHNDVWFGPDGKVIALNNLPADFPVQVSAMPATAFVVSNPTTKAWLTQNELKWSFTRPDFIHPLLVQRFVPDLAEGNHEYVLDLLQNLEWRPEELLGCPEFYDDVQMGWDPGGYPIVRWCPQYDYDDPKWEKDDPKLKMDEDMDIRTWLNQSFGYRCLGISPSGICILYCWDSGGGSGIFKYIVLLTLETYDYFSWRNESDIWLSSGETPEVEAYSGEEQYIHNQRILIKYIASISLGDRYNGFIRYDRKNLLIGPDISPWSDGTGTWHRYVIQ